MLGWAAWPDLEAAGGAAGGWGRETGSSRIRATLLKSPATVGESGLFLFRFCSESAHGGSPGALRAAPVPGTPGRGWGGVRGGKGPPSREGRGKAAVRPILEFLFASGSGREGGCSAVGLVSGLVRG